MYQKLHFLLTLQLLQQHFFFPIIFFLQFGCAGLLHLEHKTMASGENSEQSVTCSSCLVVIDAIVFV